MEDKKKESAPLAGHETCTYDLKDPSPRTCNVCGVSEGLKSNFFDYENVNTKRKGKKWKKENQN